MEAGVEDLGSTLPRICYKCWWEELSMAQFKPGDVVRLKSGGPSMTVEKIGAEGWIVCNWFAEGKELKTGTFVADALEPAKPLGISMG